MKPTIFRIKNTYWAVWDKARQVMCYVDGWHESRMYSCISLDNYRRNMMATSEVELTTLQRDAFLRARPLPGTARTKPKPKRRGFTDTQRLGQALIAGDVWIFDGHAKVACCDRSQIDAAMRKARKS
jgi:hypothetical protein